MKRIYLDYASLTPIDKRVMREMKEYSGKDYGNPSALYTSGVAAKKALLAARTRIASVLHAHSDEIIFTSGGTEANNLAFSWIEPGQHIIVSAIEHSSIMETARRLEKKGVAVSYIGVDKNGIVNVDEIKKAIKPETALVSIMSVNNETGTIEPITEIAKIVRHARVGNNSRYPLLHTDACQAAYLPLHVEKLGIDLMTLDGHKIYGPRGVGMFYVKRGTLALERAGTENLPGIMGLARALELADTMREKETGKLSELKDFFVKEIKEKIPGTSVNGSLETTSPHILNISIPDVDTEFLVLKLDAKGIECSTKSACLTGDDESYVLKNIGADSRTSIRVSFGRETTKSDLKKVLKTLILESWNISRNSKSSSSLSSQVS